MHQTDRVKLQFGLEQEIPSPPRCLKELHEMTIIKSWHQNFHDLNKEEQKEWKRRRCLILKGNLLDSEHKPSQEYMTWFKSI